MNQRYQGINGATYYVRENKIAGGGEGAIHEIEGNPSQVAKIFRVDKRTPQREEKLKLMVQHKLSPQQLEQITWPQDVIYDHTGFVGYIMPRLHASSSLAEVYSGTNYDLRFRLLTAINLCAAVETVHSMGQVCGDLNPQNICVNLNKNDRINGFKVTLVDTDSYHFSANGNTYRCEVGLGDYIAPEVQIKLKNGTDLRTIPLPSYTRESDLFALAVHIFCLLMNGCHPFACAKETNPNSATMKQMTGQASENSVVAPQPIENIVDGFFPFFQKKDGIQIPVYAPEFSSLPQHIQTLFIRTFVEGYQDSNKRASETEWIEALKRVQLQSSRCNIGNEKIEEHYFFDHNINCPMCAINDRILNTMKGLQQFMGDEEKNNMQSDSKENANFYYTPQFTNSTSNKPKSKKQKKSKAEVAAIIIGIVIVMLLLVPFIVPVFKSNCGGYSDIPEYNYQEEIYEETPSPSPKPAPEQIVQNFGMFGIQMEAPTRWELYESDYEYIYGDFDEDVEVRIYKFSSHFATSLKLTQKPTKAMWNYYEEYGERENINSFSQKRIKLGKLWFIKQAFVDYYDDEDLRSYHCRYILNGYGIEYEFELESDKPISGKKAKEFEKVLSSLKIQAAPISLKVVDNYGDKINKFAEDGWGVYISKEANPNLNLSEIEDHTWIAYDATTVYCDSLGPGKYYINIYEDDTGEMYTGTFNVPNKLTKLNKIKVKVNKN